MSTGVVVPYFQREPGILLKALESVFAQHDADVSSVVVVDDASPSPAEADIANLDADQRNRVVILHQANGGPGAARNTALSHFGTDIEFVAFIDSDDQWDATHLARGLNALAKGYDVYFSNLLDFDSPIDYFQRRGGLWREHHPQLTSTEPVFGYAGRMNAQILAANFIQLSTVIFRRATAPSLRFRTEFRRAGEDILFWLELARLTNRFCYSTAIEVYYGRGVNVYRSAASGSEAAFERLRDETRFRRTVLQEFVSDRPDRSNARRALRQVRKQFAAEILHRLSRRQTLSMTELTMQWQLDPFSVLSLPVNCIRCVTDWMSPSRDPSLQS